MAQSLRATRCRAMVVEEMEGRALLTAFAKFPIPADPDGEPSHITTGPDGNLWFTETDVDGMGVDKIGMNQPRP